MLHIRDYIWTRSEKQIWKIPGWPTCRQVKEQLSDCFPVPRRPTCTSYNWVWRDCPIFYNGSSFHRRSFEWASACVLCLVVQSCPTFCKPMDCSPPGSSVHGDSPGKNTGEGCSALLQGVFPAQGSNPGLPHCRWILFQLSHQGSPRILEWVAYPFSRGSSQPRSRTGVSCLVGRFFTSWATGEAPRFCLLPPDNP